MSEELIVGILVVVVGGVMSWLAYMARQLSRMAEFTAATTETLRHLSDGLERANVRHDRLARDFYGHVDDEKDRRIAELEMRLAEAHAAGTRS